MRHAVTLAVAMLSLFPASALAYRMIQSPDPGRTSFGARVPCDAAGGFVHWMSADIPWRLNPSGAGGAAGIAPALQSAMAAWSGVAPAAHVLTYAGTTSGGFATDGINTVLWDANQGCTGGCLALTALVLGPGQEILEADIVLNPAAAWSTSGGDHDVEAIVAHELGHALGIHHTDVTKKTDRPTMYADYFGMDGRSLGADDRDALNCAEGRYPPGGGSTVGVEPSDEAAAELRLWSRTHAGSVRIRYALGAAKWVRLELFDVAGRLLATLVDGERGAGEHEVAWSGETHSGRAGSGVYFARLSAAGMPVVAKVVRVE